MNLVKVHKNVMCGIQLHNCVEYQLFREGICFFRLLLCEIFQKKFLKKEIWQQSATITNYVQL